MTHNVSYPYFNVSRRMRVDYGRVLGYVALYERFVDLHEERDELQWKQTYDAMVQHPLDPITKTLLETAFCQELQRRTLHNTRQER